LAHAGIATPLQYGQNRMGARGDDNEWFLASRHELAYLTRREMAGVLLSLSLSFNVALSLLFVGVDISGFDVSPMGACELRYCEM